MSVGDSLKVGKEIDADGEEVVMVSSSGSTEVQCPHCDAKLFLSVNAGVYIVGRKDEPE